MTNTENVTITGYDPGSQNQFQAAGLPPKGENAFSNIAPYGSIQLQLLAVGNDGMPVQQVLDIPSENPKCVVTDGNQALRAGPSEVYPTVAYSAPIYKYRLIGETKRVSGYAWLNQWNWPIVGFLRLL